MIIQKAQFSTGGFVIHKIRPLSGKPGRISAWFDLAGGLIDVEYVNIAGRATVVKPGGKLWNHIAALGRIYK
jgi:hypothetical protein